MAIKRKEQLLNTTLSATPSTYYSNWVNTENYKDFIFVLRMGAANYTGGASGDTIICAIEASSTNDITQHASRIRTLNLTDPSDNTISRVMDTVAGNLTLPADTATATALRQQWDYKSPNIDEYVRLRYTTAGVPTTLGTVIVDMYANKET